MKQTILTSLLFAVSTCAAAINTGLFDYSNDLLVNNAKTKFTNGASSVVVKDYINGGNDNFRIAGMGDRVELQSISQKDWYFQDKIIYTWEIPFTSDVNDPSTYQTISLTAEAKHNSNTIYEFDAIKYRKGNQTWFEIVGVYGATVPEPSAYVLILGFLSLVYVMWKRRHVK